jgi:integrase
MKSLKVSDINTNENRIRRGTGGHKKSQSPSDRVSEVYRHAYELGKAYYFKRLSQIVYGDKNPTLNAHIYLFNEYQIHDFEWSEIEKLVVDIVGMFDVDIVDEDLFQWLHSSVAMDSLLLDHRIN